MRDLGYNEKILHRTGEMPLAFYAVDKNHPRYQMRMHWHRETEIICVHSGRLLLYVDEMPLTLKAGEAVILGGGALHGAEPEEAIYSCLVFDAHAMFAQPEGLRHILRSLNENTVLLFGGEEENNNRLRSVLNRLFAYAKENRLICAYGAIFEMFGTLAEQEKSLSLCAPARSAERSEALKPAIEYIEKNYAAKITLQMLSRLTGLSEKYFCASFKQVMHRSPIEYLNHYRIERACEMLIDGKLSVAEIAFLCGFTDSSFFIKQFKRRKGITPNQYRKTEI